MSEGATHSDLWAGVVAEYERQTEREIDRDHAFRDLQSLDDLKNKIKQGTESFNTFRSEHHRLYSALANCIQPLQPILGIVQNAMGNTPYAPVSIVFGAASHLLQACDSVSKAYDGIEELFEQMKDITVRLEEYDCSGMESSLQTKMTQILAYFLDIFGKAEACIRRKRIKQWARSVFMREDSINSSLNKLRKYVDTELGLVIALTYRRVNHLQASTTDMHADLKLTSARTDEVLSMQRSDRQRAFSEAEEKTLSDSLRTKTVDEMAREHDANAERLTEGTGHWIRDDCMFQAWEQEKAPVLWVFGKPGVGKTMLAARTIEMLQDMYPQHADIPSLTSVSYLYFKDDNPALQDCAQMWKTAAFQITKANDRFKKHVIATISKKQDSFASARRIWQQLFLDFFLETTPSQSATSLAFIIVDGVDEAPEAERVKFLTCLAELLDRRTNDHKCRIQVAVFARPSVRRDPGFEKFGYWTQHRTIEVTPERNNLDIEAFIRQRLSDVSVLKMLKKRRGKEYQTLAKQIYDSVRYRSQGMFLWAKLTFDQIRESPSPEAIRESLQRAPKGLDDMLHHVFKRLDIEEQMNQSYLSDLLSWVLCAHRPLYVSELFVLILINPRHHYYKIEDDVKGRYSSLFDVTGPTAGFERDEQEPQRSVDDSESEQDDFDFLNQSDSCDYDEDTVEDSEGADGDTEEAQSPIEEIVSTALGVNQVQVDIPSPWYQTTITFSHARIRDCLTIEGNPSTRRWHDCAAVPANLNLTRLSIVHQLLNVLSTDIADAHVVDSLKTYTKTFWVKHLEELDFAGIDRPNAAQLARKLSEVFRSGQRMLEMSSEVGYEFVETWFSTSKYSSLVRGIITEHLEVFDGRERDWALSVKKSARGLFQPLITACANKWLTKTGWDDSAYLDKSQSEVWIMYAFSALTDEGTNDGSVDMSENFTGIWNIPLDAIESIANVEPLQRSEHYYSGIAWIMMEADETVYTERAIEYFQKALELKPGGWMAMEGLARCFGDNLHEYETAIQWMERAIHNVPQTEDFQGIEFYLETRIPDWSIQLGNNQEAVGKAQTAYECSRGYWYGTGGASDDSILRCIKHYTEALYRTENYDQIIELLYELDGTETGIQDTSLWTEFMKAQYDVYYRNDIFDKVGKIARVVKSDSLQDFMRASIKKSIKLDTDSIAQDELIWLADQAAKWQYSYALQPEESIELWESVVTLVDQSSAVVQHSQSFYRTRAAGFLGMMYFDAAKNSRNNRGDASANISKLENLAKHKQGSKQYYRASYPALILGMWLHEYAKVEEEVWRACIRPSIKQALHLLSDEDPWNDQGAYAQLGQALLLAGDSLNASIALGITTKPMEEQCSLPQQSDHETNVELNTFELVPTAAELAKQHLEGYMEEAVDHQTGDSSTSCAQDRQSANSAKEEVGPAGALEGCPGQGEDESKDEEITDDDESTVSVNPRYAGFDCMWTCGGPCDTPNKSYAAIYFCRVCNNVCFCEKCVELVRKDEMPFRYCAKDHPFVRAFPMVEEARRVTDALVERRFEVQQAWLKHGWRG